MQLKLFYFKKLINKTLLNNKTKEQQT